MPTQGSNYLFLESARCGSGSIQQVLTEQYGGERCERDAIPAAVEKGKYIFMTTRDPYERALSLWWALCSPGDWYGVREAGMTAPADLIHYLASGDFGRSKRGVHGHCDQTCAQVCRDVQLDSIIHYEALLEEFNELPFLNKVHTSLPIVGKKAYGPAERWPLQEPEFRLAIEEWLVDDFTQFGYYKR